MQSKETKYLIALAISLSASVVLAGFRFYWSESFQYLFLIWNLFLAFVPFVMSTLISWSENIKNRKGLFLIAAICWVLFFPNAPYIITDFFHLKPKQNIPLWYDIFLIFSFAWNGLLLAFMSLSKMQLLVSQLFGKWKSWLFAVVVLISSSFGIYIGRFLRWNSWDVLYQPKMIAYETYSTFTTPFFQSNAWGVVIVLSFFLLMTYSIIAVLTK